MNRLPKYTVTYTIKSPECNEFVGTGWEFFWDEGHASLCYQRHLRLGNCPAIRPFHQNDTPHLGPLHRMRLTGT